MRPRRIAEIFAEQSTLQAYLQIEAALAQAEADLGVIPKDAAQKICHYARLDMLDMPRLRAQAQRSGYAVAPLVRQLTEVCGDYGHFLHWGATTQDVVNTGLALQVNEVFRAVLGDLSRLTDILVDKVQAHRDTVMAARTFGGHALPITFSFKASVWLASVLRHVERVKSLIEHPLEGEFAGVAGTLASLGKEGLAVRKRLMELLALPEPVITWASMRDDVYERMSVLAGITNTLAKIAQDIAELSSTEIGELAEPNTGGKDTSSTLPYKSNPILCAQITAAAALVAQYTATALYAGRQRQERSGEGLLEIQVIAPACVEAENCISRSMVLLVGLQVFPDRMRANLDATHGIILAERFMMALAPRLGRLRSHDLVHDACRVAVERNVDLRTALRDIPEVANHLSPETLDSLADPMGYLGSGNEISEAVVNHARRCVPRAES
ncbi:MAG: adenylosuccinate lyase family protein [Betaproteobacteria bacterium]|nr:MAG: adenylosuccinate lyase family protein [Betaproteobacteria bacterium]